MTLAAGSRLGPYEILSPLGAGGMGEVYRARDTRLDRDVAIKVLPVDLSSRPEALARFEREAKAVAALSHPNILAIHDVGRQDDISYAVMELLEGQTLRERLASERLPLPEALNHATQIARGLAAAHEKAIVHRDLKPENIFITKNRHLKILDFGLAKRVPKVAPDEETSAPTVSLHTEPGVVMGTVGYMSPEQVQGEIVDHRSDIFSFGAILYEMLSGNKAFGRKTAAETIAAIMRDEPPALSESGRNISPALEHIVRHCLEKDRDNRFQTAKDVAFNLSEQSSQPIASAGPAVRPTGKRKAVIAGAVVVVLAVGAALLMRRLPRGAPEVRGVNRVAVLPFENLGSPEDDYFADGMADSVRGKLTTLPGVVVIARNSSTPYKKTTKTAKEIAGELQVGYLLTATVRWQKGTGGASRVEVSPELVEIPASGTPTSKWQQPFNAALTDVFHVQSDIATRVAQALGVALGAGDEKRLSEKPTQNLAAYDAFLKGEQALHDLSSTEKATGFYEQAVALDPGFALAWARVAWLTSSKYLFNSTPEVAERAKQATEKAVALAPNLPEVYLALGAYRETVRHDPEGALEEFEKGQRIAPSNADLVMSMGSTEFYSGRWQEAVEHFRRAEHLDPRSPIYPTLLGNALLWLRRYPEARAAYDRGLSLTPSDIYLVESKASTFLGEGDLVAARTVVKAVPKDVEETAFVALLAKSDLVWVLDEQQRELLLRLTPSAFEDDRGVWGLCLAQAYALNGDTANVRTYAEKARKAWAEQLRAKPDDADVHLSLGRALAYLGRNEEAMREGARGVALVPAAHKKLSNSYLSTLVRIYILVGELEKALDMLEPLLKVPSWDLSPGWLKIDPNFDPLRKNPRFQKLIAGTT